MFGGDIEDAAASVIYAVLTQDLGWRVDTLSRSWQAWDGRPMEIDLFGRAEDPAHPGQPIWIVGEAKINLTARQVDRFATLAARARRHLSGRVFPLCFCYRARPEVQQRVVDSGLNLVFSFGRLVPAAP